MNRISRLAPLVVWIICGWSAAALAQTATITGRIVDARTGQPLARVLVHVEHQAAFAETDDTGGFSLSLPPGTHTITASLIGYAIVRQTVDIAAGAPREMVIELSEGAGSFEEVDHRHRRGAEQGRRGAGRLGAARTRSAGAARRHARRSAAGRPGVAGGRVDQRLLQRVQRPRQRLSAHRAGD